MSAKPRLMSCIFRWLKLFSFCIFIISVNAGLVSTWRMMGRLVLILMNAPLPFLAASAASTLTAHTSACVWMATKPWSGIPTHARPCQVSLISSQFGEFQCLPVCSTRSLMSFVPHFSWRAFSHNGRPPWDPETECRWLKLHHLETGSSYVQNRNPKTTW